MHTCNIYNFADTHEEHWSLKATVKLILVQYQPYVCYTLKFEHLTNLIQSLKGNCDKLPLRWYT